MARMSGLPERWALGAVLSSSLGVGLIFGFQPPLIAFVLGRSAASAFAIGAVTAASLIAVIACGPLYPRVIERLGLKLSVIAGILIGAVVLALMPAVSGVPAWMCLRIVTGCALGLSWIASEVWLNTMSSEQARGTVMGLYGTVFSVGIVAGPLLLELTGTQGARPFLCGSLCLVVTLLPLLLLRDTTPVVGERAALGELVAAMRFAPLVMLAAAVAGLVESADLSLLPLYGLHLGLSERNSLALVTVFMVGNVVLQMPIGFLADRFGRHRLLGCCAAVSAIGPVVLPACVASPTLLGPLLFLWGGTLYAFYSQGIALLGEEFPASALAKANTVFVMVYCAGGVIGPSVGGLAMDQWPRAGLPAVLCAAPLVLLFGLARRAAASQAVACKR